MSCERNSGRAAASAAQSGIPKTSSKSAATTGASRKKEAGPREKNGKEIPDPDPRTRSGARQRALTARNVKTFHTAIRQGQRVSITYRPVNGAGRKRGGARKYKNVIPLDVKGGSTAQSRQKRYMWTYHEKIKGPLCMRLDRVLKVEKSEGSFDPQTIAQSWKGKTVVWNLPRDAEAGWGGKPMTKKKPAKAAKKPAKKKSSKKR
jgi:hypothetical protein